MINATIALGFPFEWNLQIPALNLGPLWLGLAFVAIAIILYKNVEKDTRPRVSNHENKGQSTRSTLNAHASPIHVHLINRDKTEVNGNNSQASPPGRIGEVVEKKMHCTNCGSAFDKVMNQLIRDKGKVYCCSCGQGFMASTPAVHEL